MENISCAGDHDGQLYVHATGGNGMLMYSLDGQVYEEDPLFLHLAPGMGIVSVKDENNCVLESSFIITEPGEISASIIIDSVSCKGQSDGQLAVGAHGGTGNLTYSINGIIFQDSSIFTNLPIGEGALYIIDQNNCAEEFSYNIPGPEELDINVQEFHPVTCFGNSDGIIGVAASGGNGSYEFSFDGGSFSDVSRFESIEPGSHVITVRDQHDCAFTFTFIMNQPDSLTAKEIVLIDDDGSNSGSIEIVAEGGTPPYQYSLDNGAFMDNNFFDQLSYGDYLVSIKDFNDCEKSYNLSLPLSTAILDANQIPGFSFYPNPFVDFLVLDAKGQIFGKDMVLEITDLGGKCIQSMQINQQSSRIQLNLTHLVPGLYFGILQTKSSKRVIRLIKM
jgi:hypothetical protein